MNSKQVLWSVYAVLFLLIAVGITGYIQYRKISAERAAKEAEQLLITQ